MNVSDEPVCLSPEGAHLDLGNVGDLSDKVCYLVETKHNILRIESMARINTA